MPAAACRVILEKQYAFQPAAYPLLETWPESSADKNHWDVACEKYWTWRGQRRLPRLVNQKPMDLKTLPPLPYPWRYLQNEGHGS